jgi:hypothetical protein
MMVNEPSEPPAPYSQQHYSYQDSRCQEDARDSSFLHLLVHLLVRQGCDDGVGILREEREAGVDISRGDKRGYELNQFLPLVSWRTQPGGSPGSTGGQEDTKCQHEMRRAERCGQAPFNAEAQVPDQVEKTAEEKDADPEDGEFIAPWNTSAPGMAFGVIAPGDAGKEQLMGDTSSRLS